MALGIVPDDIFNSEVDKYLNGHVVEAKKLGRPEDSINVPESLKKLIGDTQLESGRKAAQEIADAFGIGNRSRDVYARGATSLGSYHNPTKTLGAHIAKTKERIAVKAGRIAKGALNSITDEKLENLDATQAINVARSAAAIIKDMTPQEVAGNTQNNQVQFVIHAPKLVDESKFNVIEVVSDDK